MKRFSIILNTAALKVSAILHIHSCDDISQSAIGDHKINKYEVVKAYSLWYYVRGRVHSTDLNRQAVKYLLNAAVED